MEEKSIINMLNNKNFTFEDIYESIRDNEEEIINSNNATLYASLVNIMFLANKYSRLKNRTNVVHKVERGVTNVLKAIIQVFVPSFDNEGATLFDLLYLGVLPIFAVSALFKLINAVDDSTMEQIISASTSNWIHIGTGAYVFLFNLCHIPNYEPDFSDKTGYSYDNYFIEIYKYIIGLLNKIIEKDDCPDEFLFYITTINNYETIFSDKAVARVRDCVFRLNNQKSKFKSKESNSNYIRLLFKVFDFNAEPNKPSTNVGIDFIKKIDILETDEMVCPIIVPTADEVINILNNKKINEIEYGEFPYGSLTDIQVAVLNKAFKLKLLNKTNKMFRIIGPNGKIMSYPVYEFYGKKFLKMKGEWIEVLPIKWTVNKELGCLVFKEMKLPKVLMSKLNLESNLRSYLKNIFLKDIEIKESTSFEDEVLKTEIQTISGRVKAIDDARELELQENRRKEEIKLLREHLLKQLVEIDRMSKEIAQTVSRLNKLTAKDNSLLVNSGAIHISRVVGVSREILMDKVGDHYEIWPKFLPYLKWIDLSLMPTDKLKASNIDFRGTNISANPQQVYEKDLSGSAFDDENLFGDFRDVKLCGSDISRESFPINVELAITDDKTKLPQLQVERGI